MAALSSTRPYRRGAPPSLPDEGRYVANELKKVEQALAVIQAPDMSGKMDKAANLSDVLNTTTARGNLGLGSAATHAATDFELAGKHHFTVPLSLNKTGFDNAAAASAFVVVPAGTYTFSSSVTYASSVTWWFLPGAVVQPASGIIVTFLGRVMLHPAKQAFDVSAGSGCAVRGPRQLTPENFGAANSNSGNDSTAINAADASINYGAHNSAPGPSVLTLLPGAGYRITSAVQFTPDNMNNLHVVGDGMYSTSIVAASGGSYVRGAVTVVGGGETSFKLADFSILAAYQNFPYQGLTLGTAGGNINAGSRRNVIENVSIKGFIVGCGWYNTRQLDWTGGSIWLPRYEVTAAANNGAGAIRLTMDDTTGLTTGMSVDAYIADTMPNANGTFTITVISSTQVDLSGSTYGGTFAAFGHIVPSAAIGFVVDSNEAGDFSGDANLLYMDIIGGSPGLGGTGIHFRSEDATQSRISGWRMLLNLYCFKTAIKGTTAGGGTINDQWLLDGSQVDGWTGTVMDYTGNAGAASIRNIRVGDVYIWFSKAVAFSFSGTNTDEITDIRISGVRARHMETGSGHRFVNAVNVAMLNVTDNQLAQYEGLSGPGELVNLFNCHHVTIGNNTAVPDGISTAVTYFVTMSGTTTNVTVTGNNAAGAVTNMLNNASGLTVRLGHNLPASTDI
jgi:hypothetical protein